MTDPIEMVRTELAGRFEPPIDVMLDPSLLVSAATVTSLSDSRILEAQTQATLTRDPTDTRLGDLYVPGAFRELIREEGQLSVQKTEAWSFFRGQAEGAYRDDIHDVIDEHGIEPYDGRGPEGTVVDLDWTGAFDDPEAYARVATILREEVAFLLAGGLLLARRPMAIEAFRDAGMPTVDIGSARLQPEVRERLDTIGYGDPATVCAFGVATGGAVVRALTGGVLRTDTDGLVYYCH